MLTSDPTTYRVLYQIPDPNTLYAGRFIYEGYKNAFEHLNIPFRPLTSTENSRAVFDEFKPTIFITSYHKYFFKFLDLDYISKLRQGNLKMFTAIGAWHNLTHEKRNDGLQSDRTFLDLVRKNLAGDIFYNWIDKDSEFMNGFQQTTGARFEQILLAADSFKYRYRFEPSLQSDIAYVGHNLRAKRSYFKEYLFPLFKKYNTKVYGADWTLSSRTLGLVQKVGQYYNIEPLKRIRKLDMVNDNLVYSSATININLHGEHQVKHASDINERTFKIPASGGFEICDNVKIIRKYFTSEELVIGENKDDWFDKIDYYLKNPAPRQAIIEAGRKKVLSEHTYVNRAQQVLSIYDSFF